MATPLTADRLVQVLRAEGCRVVEYRDWRTHNRNHKGPWGGVNGLTIHHTAGVGSGMVNFCYNGYSSLPGPLCHTVLTKAAHCYMVGHGRANHAGRFAQNAHNAVVNESSTHPRPDATEPVDGNQHYYGLEIENEGDSRDPYPADQYDQAVRWAAAICRAHGWTADSVIGHKEGTRRKIDPSFSMTKFRADVAERLRHPASWRPTEEDDMPSNREIAEAVWRTDNVIDVPWGTKENPAWMGASIITDTGERVRRIEATLKAQGAAIGELAKALASHDQTVDADALVARIEAAIERMTVRIDVTQED